jgi:methylphosphotriester-DNA--protein-cysteine methyltransferase
MLRAGPSAPVRLSVQAFVDLCADRLFERFLGVSPRFLARIMRFQRALALLTTGTLRGSLADIALESGCYDQSHFIRDFTAFAGGVPHRYQGYLEGELSDFAPNVVRFVQGG